MLYHVGDSQHTQNIQINKVIGEKEKCVFYGKNHMDFFTNPVHMLKISRANYFLFTEFWYYGIIIIFRCRTNLKYVYILYKTILEKSGERYKFYGCISILTKNLYFYKVMILVYIEFNSIFFLTLYQKPFSILLHIQH